MGDKTWGKAHSNDRPEGFISERTFNSEQSKKSRVSQTRLLVRD